MPGTLSIKGLYSDLRSHLRRQNLDIFFQGWKHLFDDHDLVGQGKMSLYQVAGKGPCGGQFQDSRFFLYVECLYCLLAVEIAGAARYYQKLGSFRALVGVKGAFFKDLGGLPQFFLLRSVL